MSDPQVATKAPESDAAESQQPTSTSAPAPSKDTATAVETSLFPGDSIAQTGASMGEHCVSDRPLPSDSIQPAGEMSTLNNITCYISKPSTYPHSPSKLLLLLTGGTGIESINNQLQADVYASRGFVVVMPDQFGGDAAPNTHHADTAVPMSPVVDGPSSLLEWIKGGVADAAKSFRIDMWLARHTPERVLPILSKVLEGAREQFADAVANGGGVYGAGYCFGAKYILLLCGVGEGGKDAEATPAAPELKAGAIAHGTLVTKEDIEGVKAPIAMVCVSDDNLFPNDVREQGRASLELNAIEHEIKVFEGAPHGFAVVGDYADEGIKTQQKEAFEMMAAWLEKY